MEWRAAVVLSLVLAGPVEDTWGNPGHEITIAELDAQINLAPHLPELYFQRAWNYREMGRLAEARADWKTTLGINPGFLPASRELARADAAEGKLDEAITGLRQAMAAAPKDQAFHLAGCHGVLAELLLKHARNAEALAEANLGLDKSPDLVMDLCLLRSEAQRRLGQHTDRLRDLELAMQKLKSFVLKTRWYDAMLDAGRGPEIATEIEQELGNTRYRASWLIRRARIYLHRGEKDAAAADLAEALTEIEGRLRPGNPDISLLCDRAMIRALQGDLISGRTDLEAAQKLGADFWMTMSIEGLLTATGSSRIEIEAEKPAARSK